MICEVVECLRVARANTSTSRIMPHPSSKTPCIVVLHTNVIIARCGDPRFSSSIFSYEAPERVHAKNTHTLNEIGRTSEYELRTERAEMRPAYYSYCGARVRISTRRGIYTYYCEPRNEGGRREKGGSRLMPVVPTQQRFCTRSKSRKVERTAGVVTKTTDGDSLRYTYDGTRRVRQLALGCESN